MKILWVEDFGGRVNSREIAVSIFDKLLENSISKRWDEEDSIEKDFSEFVKENSFHEIDLVKNYPKFKEIQDEIFEYDYILIDINLSEGACHEDNPPKYEDVENFHERAGFYIFNQLLQEGFPFDNIAFMTGEKSSTFEYAYQEYFKETKVMSMPKEPKAFVKNAKGYKDVSNELIKLSSNPYLILRRGIIEACNFLKNELNNKSDSELKDYIIFNKTTSSDQDLDKCYIDDYLVKLETFFLLNPPSDRKTLLYRFVRELTVEWEMSKGYLKKGDVKYKKEIEYNLKNFCQNQMKLLRNWTAHNQLSDELTEKEIAFYFLIAMRALFNLEVDKIYRYEELLLSIFQQKNKLNKEDILNNLADSYYTLRNLGIFNYSNPEGNEFSEIIKSLGKSIKHKKDIEVAKDISIKLFYQNFFHSLKPCYLKLTEINKDEKFKKLHGKVLMYIEFEFPDLENCLFLNELAKLIYHNSFKEKKISRF